MVQKAKDDPSFISTHTLTWSVTAMIAAIETAIIISTHTLTWSVTEMLDKAQALINISTHTLTWSVTRKGFYKSHVQWDFNSHAHVERDDDVTQASILKTNFNSHAHVERDADTIVAFFFRPISTHTLTWSVTRVIHRRLSAEKFQLTRSRGA